MVFFIVMYSITFANMGWLILAWENDHGVSRWTRLQDRWSLYKNREHFGSQDYR